MHIFTLLLTIFNIATIYTGISWLSAIYLKWYFNKESVWKQFHPKHKVLRNILVKFFTTDNLDAKFFAFLIFLFFAASFNGWIIYS